MKNILGIDTTTGTPLLLSSVDAGENSVTINGSILPVSSWVGSGAYTFTVGGVAYTLNRISANSGNIMMVRESDTVYTLKKIVASTDPVALTPAEVDVAVQAGWGASLPNADNTAY